MFLREGATYAASYSRRDYDYRDDGEEDPEYAPPQAADAGGFDRGML